MQPIDCLTIIGGIIAAIATYHRKSINEKISRATRIILSIALICVILISSYGIFSSKIKIKTLGDLWQLFDKPTLFLTVVLFKLAIAFWVVLYLICYFKPERLMKAGAKFFNIELSQEFNLPEKIDNLTVGTLQVYRQIKLISTLNRYVLDYIAQPFEEDILQAEYPANAIRLEVYKILCMAYRRLKKIKIYVLEITDQNIATLEPPLYRAVKRKWDQALLEGEDQGDVEEGTSIGIAVHRGSDGLATVIIIDASQQNHYELSNAELAAASTLFVAVSSIITLAIREKDRYKE